VPQTDMFMFYLTFDSHNRNKDIWGAALHVCVVYSQRPSAVLTCEILYKSSENRVDVRAIAGTVAVT
jgi:hypothetical protein